VECFWAAWALGQDQRAVRNVSTTLAQIVGEKTREVGGSGGAVG